MINTLGFRFIFWDAAYSICLAALSAACMFILLFFIPGEYSYSASVALSPMLSMLITFFTETAERTDGLYELKHTCRYTIRQITALRTLCFSAVGVVFTSLVTALAANSAGEFFRLLLLSLSMLFICAFIQLSALRSRRGKRLLAAVSIAWALVNAALPLRTNGHWESFLRGCPAAIAAAVMILSLAAFCVQFKKMFMEVRTYAVA
jgi:hypothetical protein